ncbi:ThuA domain-containing protein [Phytoactinopolyspora limicola]|uniref:ThuA domain-containing protein n=1 Tax=Phytoactinopolyspora limicola TaxID=2715536 RepID=UPI00140878BB|nr:ThuA domain-containing protein [Phytoactinopolyspora limicola]
MNVARHRWWKRPLAGTVTAALGLSLLATAQSVAHEHPDEHDQHGEAHVLIFTATAAGPWHDHAIEYGTPIVQNALEDVGITSVATDDPAIFTDEDLAQFDGLVMFHTNGDPWNDEQKAAMERYQQAGNGIAAVHNATDMRGNYQWWDDLVGTLMPGHADNNPAENGLQATVQVEDSTHPSTAHLEGFEWVRNDEWYNFSTNVRGDAHVLLSIDETTYNPGQHAMGYDHPLAWCKMYDGGRAWATALGHFPAHYDEPEVVQHMVGGIQWIAGAAEGDCGGTVWDSFDKVSLDTDTSAPFGMDIAPDGRVFFTELVRGQIRVFNPETHTTTTALTIPVYSGGEDGMKSIVLDPDFEENGWLYVYYAPVSNQSVYVNRLSRFTVGEGNVIDPDSESVVIEIPKQRFDQPGHTGGGLGFDPDGNLLLSVGDDINPHTEPSPSSAPLSTIEGTFHDARETSANTADLRGKLLRITPQPDGGYTVPDGNMFNSGRFDDLFPDGVYDPELALPEIYAMGFRNPFRFAVDPVTGHIGLADYGPDCNNLNNCGNYGPTGMVSWALITEPGNYGWPMCHGDKRPYRDVDYTTNPRTFGELFDCDNPVNDSPRNTGLQELPPVVMNDMVYGYQMSTVPEIIPQGGGLAPMGGPFYQFDPDNESETKFPEYYSGKPFYYEWSKNRLYSMIVDHNADEGERLQKINHFLPPPEQQWLAPIELKFGADGSLYVLEWGGGFGRHNPDSGLYRIDYVPDGRSPIAVAEATPDSGHSPLEVEFSSEKSHDPEGGELTYEWDFENDGETDTTEPNPTYTYTEDGVYSARLTVTNENGMTGVAVATITVGNTRPDVEFTWPPDGGFFEWGDEISWDLSVSDPEDEEIVAENAVVQPAIGHDDHAHSFDPIQGLTGSITAGLSGHSRTDNAFYVLDGRYTDQGTDTAPPLVGSQTVVLQPKFKQAEHFTSSDGITTSSNNDVEAGNEVISGSGGAWAAYDPVNLTNIDSIALRVASAAGGAVELRRDAPDGDLLGTAEVPATGGLSRFVDVAVELDDPGETFVLYLVFPDPSDVRVNFFEAVGKGISPESRPEVRITSPDGSEQLEAGEVEITAEASDAENEITQVEFFVDGDSIGVDGSAPYTVTWNAEEEKVYQLTAVATNNLGLTTTSRIVRAQVGELFGDFETFANTTAEFERLGGNQWAVTANGANMWQATDQYGSLYLPSAAGTRWAATVKIESQQNTNNSAKAGLIVRNDVTSPGTSPGYAAMTMRAGNAYEWLRDTTGNGQLNASDGGGQHEYPAWVRIVRDGDTYTAYRSSDGENFIQVGPSEVLPGAADIQDIGMVVTAHNANQTSRAVFSDFELDLDPQDPDDPDDPELECPDDDPDGGVRAPSDEFDGDALDGCRWSVLRTAPGTEVTQVDGQLVLPVTNGDINESEPGPISYLGQPALEGEWEIETRLTLEHTREWQYGGLMLHADDDNYVRVSYTASSATNRFLEFQSETNGSRTWHANNVAVPGDPDTVHLRLASDGSELTAAYSVDGEDWTDLDGAAVVKEDATVGLVAAGDTGAIEVDAYVDYFRVAGEDDEDVTYEAVQAILDELHEEGAVQRRSYNKLRTQLSIAERAANRGKISEAEQALDRFISFAEEVDDEEVTAQLIDLAEALRTQLHASG